MTLQVSGTISLSNLRTEYTTLGPRAQVKLSEFYYGSTYLRANNATNRVRNVDTQHPRYTVHFANIPALSDPKVPIRLTNFYGRAYYYARQGAITVSGNNASVTTTDVENESPKAEDINTVFFDVSTSNDCQATATDRYGLSISNNSRSWTTCYFINDFRVMGRGGSGGQGGQCGNGFSGARGANGGPAFYSGTSIYVDNRNRILGGGGGGGGGDARRNSYNECYCCNVTNASIAGSGGGGGKGGGAGAGPGSAPSANFTYGGGTGSNGDYNNDGGGGAGGSSCSYNTVLGNYCSNSGGAGGGWGASGGSSGGGGGAGGAGIYYRNGIRYVVVSAGTVAGGTGAV